MSSSEQAVSPSPWISVWFNPRQTIERILAETPRRGAVLLGSLGLIAGTVGQLLSVGVRYRIFDWHLVVALAIACAIAGFTGLYIWAFIIKWCGRLLGGRTSTADLRAVIAWSTTPSILGLAVALVLAGVALGTGNGTGAEADDTTALIVTVLRAVVLVCGIWSAIIFALMFSRAEGFGFWRTVTACILGWTLNIVLALLIAFGVRTFLFQPFNTPSHSMSPTLLLGDYFFVSKYAYGYTHFSIPTSPNWFSGRIFASEPARGDVAVFRIPKDDNVDYVKRVVGLPGDRIQVRRGVLYINNAAVKRELIADFIGGDSCGGDPAAKVKRWRETLPNAVSYDGARLRR